MAGIPESLMHQAAARSGIDAVVLSVLAIVQRGHAVRNAPVCFPNPLFWTEGTGFLAMAYGERVADALGAVRDGVIALRKCRR